MQYLDSSIWEKIVEKIKRAPQVLLFLDYDGTLTPIISRPQDAKLKTSTQSVLKALTKKSKFTVGIVTGRSVKQMRSFVGLDSVLIAGTHGLELWDPNSGDRYTQAPNFKKKVKRLKAKLKNLEREFAGSYLEDKELSLAYHYRLTNPCLRSKIETEFFRILLPQIRKGELKILEIKKGWELLPPVLWDKGKAVEWILARQPKKTLCFFMGDDVTDEAVFKVLKRRGITVRVGKKEGSQARYFVRNVPEAVGFLSSLANSSKLNQAYES